MAASSNLDVAYVAKLARINLTESEEKTFQKQLDDVLKYVEKLRELDVSNVDLAANVPATYDLFREDAPRDWFTAEQVLSNAPQHRNGLFIVPKVVE
jgi:aspartyl-tRNA(Asn)/glutamyl-tRNA(Gln) amidotransferase subunit C